MSASTRGSHRKGSRRLTLLNLERDGAGAFIQDGIFGRVIEKPSHRDPLLITSRQRIPPFPLNIPTTFSLHNVINLHDSQHLQEILIRLALCAHLRNSVRVDDLVAQRAEGEVRSLWDVSELGGGRLVHDASVHGPQATENAEEGRLAAAVRAHDEQVLSGPDVEAELANEDIAIRRDDRHVLEAHLGLLDDLASP